jgi:predicted nuclease of predicted toxin-antitoxin system
VSPSARWSAWLPQDGPGTRFSAYPYLEAEDIFRGPVLRRVAGRGSRSSAAPAVKLLVDMNLSPSWVDRLARHGFQAVHWSTIGAATAPDSEILTWATEHGFVHITNDLDFSSILAASAEAMPSVVQIRTQDLLSDVVVSIVADAPDAHRQNIERGALLSIDEAGTRVRVLPLRRSADLP